jgi:hypothetical protein
VDRHRAALEPRPDGTPVRLVHRWPRGPPPLHANGWSRFLPRLAVIAVARPRQQVAAYLCDPGNDPCWVERVASFLGRRIECVNEITELTGTPLAWARSARRSRCG